MNTDGMWRVLATDWEAESYIECWCRDRESADTIAKALRMRDNTVTVQVDKPRQQVSRGN